MTSGGLSPEVELGPHHLDHSSQFHHLRVPPFDHCPSLNTKYILVIDAFYECWPLLYNTQCTTTIVWQPSLSVLICYHPSSVVWHVTNYTNTNSDVSLAQGHANWHKFLIVHKNPWKQYKFHCDLVHVYIYMWSTCKSSTYYAIWRNSQTTFKFHIELTSGKLQIAFSPRISRAALSYACAASSAVSNVPSHKRVLRLGSLISAANFPQGLCLTPLQSNDYPH